MSGLVTIGATVGACLGYSFSYLSGFDPYIGITIGSLLGAISPFGPGE